MIEVASEPEPWDPEEMPFYLELFGETSPLVDTKGLDVPISEHSSDAAPSRSALSTYEYYWTLGLPKYRHEHGPVSIPGWKKANSLFANEEKPRYEKQEEDDLWEHLQDPAAEVYILFPTGGGWRAQEIVATVKYLIPPPPEHSWLTQVDQLWKAAQPIVSDVGTLAQTAGNLAGQPEIGAAASMLSAIAKAQINSVPQTEGYMWSVVKETYYCDKNKCVLEGLRWTLPKQMFTGLGGRLTGSVAVNFILAGKQEDSPADPKTKPNLETQSICAYAEIYRPNNMKLRVPAGDGKLIELKILPR